MEKEQIENLILGMMVVGAIAGFYYLIKPNNKTVNQPWKNKTPAVVAGVRG